MDAGTLRIILLVLGVLLLVVLYHRERRRIESEAEPEPEQRVARPSSTAPRREPRFDTRFGHDAGSDDFAPGIDAQSNAQQREQEQEREREQEEDSTSTAPTADTGLLVQLFLVARKSAFSGSAVSAAAERHHLTPGEMDIYHRRNRDSRREQVLFSMANLVNPGTFPFAEMDRFTTPGVALFSQFNGLPSDLMVYDELIQTARTMADALEADLLLPDRRPFDDKAWEGLRNELLSLINERTDASASGPQSVQGDGRGEDAGPVNVVADSDRPPFRP
ncbi:MAG: cell division protein ZipA C-terminal FtsZ-binding domain-containing protein [Lamprobacter sp.]|uniref:cell division protein ZipA C-terminal FtsZ-binding domain-containing protein n=1 Tax=Lamprobacter sp. TaxID=3100796 RepID=UPI002B2617E2|nr:cell division protein ZipA C-terminal FtsZ-binding domain-containing protein [Lamprobacter sp.]MEA3641054.1 cell division protein ZipA C-terminal FtsZ-binding domain-containing protein [Lamprobacter sp.]